MMATARTQDTDDEVLFNPSEHTDLAHFFSHLDSTETFALTANEWLGIRSGGQQFSPVGNIGPIPSPPNTQLTSATRSLMALNAPRINTQVGSRIPSGPVSAGLLESLHGSVRAWRPTESAFDRSVEMDGRSGRANEGERNTERDRSVDSVSRKRPAPVQRNESSPSKRPRSASHSVLHSTAVPNHSMGNGLSNHSMSSGFVSPQSPNKPPLLTPEQKKANHIMSEQKRRAKIRRGYDALCEVVPSLRLAMLGEAEGGGGGPSSDVSNSKKRRRKNSKTSGDFDARMDGRSGPKSESVVLTQSIDYMEHLLNRREELLSRLRNAQRQLPAGYKDRGEAKLWEKEWDGGTGMEDGEEDEDDWEDDDTA